MRFITGLVLSAFVMTGCFGDGAPNPPIEDDASQAADQAADQVVDKIVEKDGLEYGGTTRLHCTFWTKDGKGKTTSSYFEYNPNSRDEITPDMMGPYPDRRLIKALNITTANYRLTRAVVELPLKAGNTTFILDAENMWFNGSHTIQFFKAALDGEIAYISKHLAFDREGAQGRFKGWVEIAYGSPTEITSAAWYYAPEEPSAEWHTNPRGNDFLMEMGTVTCPVKP